MDAYLIALIVACAALAVVAAVLIVRHWGTWDENARQGVITQLYALGKVVLDALKNDGKIDGAELSAILTQIQAVIASARKTTLDVVSKDFTQTKSNGESLNDSALYGVSAE